MSLATRLFTLASSIAFVGCGPAPDAAAPGDTDSGETLSLHAESGFVAAKVTAEALTSDRVSVGRYREPEGQFVRGSAFGRALSLSVEGDRVAGIYGAEPFELRVEPGPGGLHFTGVVRGRPSDFWFGPRALRGTIGRCGYELTRTRSAYEGERGCGSSPEMTTVEVPQSLEAWSPPEIGAALGVFLGSRG